MRSPAFVTCLQHHISVIRSNQAFPVTQTLIIRFQNIQFQKEFSTPQNFDSGEFLCIFYKNVSNKKEESHNTIPLLCIIGNFLVVFVHPLNDFFAVIIVSVYEASMS